MTDGALGPNTALGAATKWAEKQRELRIIDAAANTAAVIVEARLAVTGRSQRDRGLGAAQKRALIAAIAMFYDYYGNSNFPTNPHQMACAIVAMAKELGVPDMDPRGGSVKSVAAAVIDTARLFDERERR